MLLIWNVLEHSEASGTVYEQWQQSRVTSGQSRTSVVLGYIQLSRTSVLLGYIELSRTSVLLGDTHTHTHTTEDVWYTYIYLEV